MIMGRIEVRELVIRATVVEESAATPGAPATPVTNNGVSLKEDIINICIERILEILRDKNER